MKLHRPVDSSIRLLRRPPQPQAARRDSHHTAGCQHCKVVLNTTEQTIHVYKGKEIYEVSDELRERLHAAIMTKCFAKK